MLIQAVLILGLLGALALTWRRARQDALSRRAAALWSLLWAGGIVVVLQPEVASVFARLLGVGRGSDAVVYVAVLGLAVLVFRQFLRLDRMERDITKLVRRIALDEMSKR